MAKKEIANAQKFIYATGKRKSAIARVRITPGTGKITINEKPLDEFYSLETLKAVVTRPFAVANTMEKYDVIATVHGGGFSGQTGAIRLGITRALLQYDQNTDPSSDASFRKILKAAGFVTRDARIKERKKYGLKKARRAPQFSKR